MSSEENRAIEQFRERAYYLLIWRTFLVTLLTVVFIVTRDFELDVVLLIGGSVALVYSLVMVLYADWLSDERIAQSQPWRATAPGDRPAGNIGRKWARHYTSELVLRFAKAASGVAIALLATAVAAAYQQ